MAVSITGLLEFRVGGVVQRAKGNFTFNLGAPKRDAIVGSDSVHGYKEVPQMPFVEGEITDNVDLSITDLINTTQENVILTLRNGKKYSWPDAWYAGDGNVQSEEGNITVRFESVEAQEI